MPIHAKHQDCIHPIALSHWIIKDLDAVAELVALLILGRSLHVERLLTGVDSPPLHPSDKSIDGAISQLSFPGATPDDPRIIHRDGWLFQFLSWIVSVREYPGAIVRAPQPRKADKGFDGLLIELEASTITSVVLCEDKATDRPRNTVTQDVWPDFESHEKGERDSELTSESITLLRQVDDIDPDELTRSSGWLEHKFYRASVATSESRLPPTVHVFKGYDDVVEGPDRNRRLTNLLLQDDMRGFFSGLSVLVIKQLESLRPE